MYLYFKYVTKNVFVFEFTKNVFEFTKNVFAPSLDEIYRPTVKPNKGEYIFEVFIQK